jgi:hypothetical protein
MTSMKSSRSSPTCRNKTRITPESVWPVRLFALCVEVALNLFQSVTVSTIPPGNSVAEHLRSNVDSVENDSGIQIAIRQMRVLNSNHSVDHRRLQMFTGGFTKGWLTSGGATALSLISRARLMLLTTRVLPDSTSVTLA